MYTPLEELKLPRRTLNALRAARLHTVEMVEAYIQWQPLSMLEANFGPASDRLVNNAIRELRAKKQK